LNSNTFQRCVRGEQTVHQAHQRGQLVAEGDQLSGSALLGVLDMVTDNGVYQTVS
jgi:hypothetical protein